MMFGDTITVLRRTARNQFGDSSYDEHHTITGVAINPTGGRSGASSALGDTDNASGAIDFREQLTNDVIVYLPRGADILASDQIELPDGQVYSVVGKPAPWHSPLTGWAPGIEVRCRRVSG
ncbi:hypothetical protein IU485_28010 [Nocardia cyriacigeorgica]|uniref:hypothetical protein n=1 Tax=Nocardia cyriacigeorgica TaxID=135487 RepID=UPI001894CC37|nr:hypothetical protein [Nocardia cyriacigeorgica]MBF6085218.1 hypothetical protein [Nocardia cyriacigeorgica]